MFKRLIIAVLALGLTMAFCGTAFSGTQLKSEPGNNYTGVNPNAPRYNQASSARNVQAPSTRQANNVLKTFPGGTIPSHAPGAGYESSKYHNGVGSFYFRLPDYYTSAPYEVTLPSVRFSTDKGFSNTLKKASVLVYKTGSKGNPGLRVYLYDDNGFGFPGAKLDSVSFPQGSFSGSGAVWADADFSAAGWVYENGAEYHIGIAAITDSPDDSLAFLSDNGSNHATTSFARNNVRLTGVGYNYWTDVSNTFVSPIDYGFMIETQYSLAEMPFTDCYSQQYNGSITSFWAAPHAVWGDSAYAMRFNVGGPETLASVTFSVYNATANVTSSKGSAYIFGDDDIHINVYNDDGFGLPGTMVASVTKLGGSYLAYPNLTTVAFAPLVLNAVFHVSLGSTGTPGLDCEAFLSDNGSTLTGRGSSAWVPGGAPTWETMLAGWGADYAMLIRANMCRDQYSSCSTLFGSTVTTVLQLMPDGNPVIGWGQRFNAFGQSCQIQNVTQEFWWRAPNDLGRAATMYTANATLSIFTDAGGQPGVSLGSITVTPADFAAAGNVGYTGSTYSFTVAKNFTSLNITVAGDYWVVVQSLGTTPTASTGTGHRIGIDNTGAAPQGAGGLWLFAPAFGGWLPGTALGLNPAAGLACSIKHCCVPFSERACSGSSDWPRSYGNNAADGASEVSLSDSWCDLNRIWSYTEINATAGTVSGIGPIIYQGKVVANFYDRYRKFDLATGTLEHTWGPGAAGISIGGVALGAQLLGSGTVAVAGGVTTIFLGGGSNNNLIAANWTTPGTTIWGIPLGANQGPVRGGAFMVLNQAGTDILFYATNSGNVVARVATTGVLWAGWGVNPVSLGGNASEVTGAADGANNLYFSTNPAAPTNGSIFKINAATGAIVWSLPPASLKGTTVFPASVVTREGFGGSVSVNSTHVFANSQILTGNFPADGVFYKLNSGTGVVEAFAASETSLRQSPIIDADRVIVPTRSRWGGGSLGGNIAMAYSKGFGTLSWSAAHPEGSGSRGAALSCEPGGVSDKLYAVTDNGWLEVLDANTGDNVFSRRWDGLGASADIAPGGIAIGNGPYVVVKTRTQYLVTLTKGADRPRLEFQSYNYVGSVDFGANPALPVNLGPSIVNTGCSPLTIGTVVADENPFIDRLPTFSIVETNEAAMMRSGDIADLITQSSFAPVKGVTPVTPDMSDEFSTLNSERDNRNRAASAAPPWLVSISDPSSGDVIAPGDTMELLIIIDQSLISRGPQSCFVQVGSDDPDFYLNDPTAKPQFKMTLVGGCLLDTTELEFGIGSANFEHVWNTGRLGDGDIAVHGFDIDGDGGSYYQGSYVYAMSQRRWAVNVAEWFSNVTDDLVSLQADPNWCDTTCKPFLTSPYNVGSISSNGITYTPIDANMVCRSYIDSVQNFDDGGGGWDVTQYSAAPFDQDSTMGLYVKSHVVGAVDEPGLTNVTVDIMTITERNGNTVPNVFLGSMNDIDLGGGDTVGLDQSISAAYAWRNTGANGIWGQIKLPFGCNQAPTINTRGLGGAQGFFAGAGVGLNAYFDSAYQFMQAPSGSVTSQAAPNASDFEQVITHYGHSFTPNETVQLGVAFFGFPNLSNATTTTTSAPATVKTMARLVNKWTGWGRGDVNNDNAINLGDIVYLAAYVNFAGPGPIPFMHLGDVDASGGAPNQTDVTYMVNYYFNCGPCPTGAFVF